MATSGTVGQTPFKVINVIEHASRRAKIPPQRLGGEALSVIRQLLFLQLSEYAAVGFPLWTKQFNLLSLTQGSPDVPTVSGTVDVINTYWRIFMPWRSSASDQNGADVSTLVSGQPGADVVIAGPNPAVGISDTASFELDSVGILLGGNAPITAAIGVQTSVDNGATYQTVQVLPSATYTPGTWNYFDLDPALNAQFYRLVYTTGGSWTLNQVLFGLSNSQNIPNGPFNIDDYYNLPNRSFTGDRVVGCYVDRTIQEPTLRIWPAPNVSAFYAGTVSALSRRYIQDPGALSNDVDIPRRWYEATVARLATRVLAEIDESMLLPDPAGGGGEQMTYMKMQARASLEQKLEAEATKAEAIVWADERDKLGPIRLTPDIGAYTK